MGVVAVGLVYDLVRRRFGRVAGFVGGLALATHSGRRRRLAAQQPGRAAGAVLRGGVVVRGPRVRDRTHALARAQRDLRRARVRDQDGRRADGRARDRGGVDVDRGTSLRGRLGALRQLLAGGAAMATVGLAWPLLVTLTPAADRPWISGTSDNSIWSLIFGYNGLGRVAGQTGGPGGGGPGAGGPAAAAPLFGGATGPFRLLQSGLGDQAGWLLGFALVSGLSVLVLTRLRRRDPRTGWLIAVGGALADDRGHVQLRQRHLPSVLRLAARAVCGATDRRRRRRDAAGSVRGRARRPLGADHRAARDRSGRDHRAGRAR